MQITIKLRDLRTALANRRTVRVAQRKLSDELASFRTTAERAELLPRDHARRREQPEAPDDRGEVEQRDPHEHAPMRPAGAEPFARRHRASPAGPHHAFDERALADEAHDGGHDNRQDDHDCDHRDLHDGEAEGTADAGGDAADADGQAAAIAALPRRLPPPRAIRRNPNTEDYMCGE